MSACLAPTFLKQGQASERVSGERFSGIKRIARTIARFKGGTDMAKCVLITEITGKDRS